ncbi:protein kinase domain-containing protein [Sporosarcina ureae]|uniref:protein kinase domain-containing protein n=1 Tax=Sporosarcina ureae TaxID=1571 RepID=UPI000A17CFBA|nr:protein kinase [Sporosarcina ureae]ARK20967.1 hypothetical protein SporoP32a_05095 [Sporosarcina ureae]
MSYLDYRKIKQLGQGGNGRVYLMEGKDKLEVAVKVSKIKNPTNKFAKLRLERFKTEAIKVHELYKNEQKGIIPVIKYELPCEKTGEFFFVMPKATPLVELQKNKNLYEKVNIFKELAENLIDLHKKNITHRDIKPENILFYNESYCFADFGLIDFPEKEDLTKIKESVGNRKTLAPEMREAFKVEDSRPADVYSFAKTLWIVLCDEEYAFDGQYNYRENNKLSLKYPNQHFVELYKLLAESTSENPQKRPSIKEFLKRLMDWKQISLDPKRSGESLWRFIEETIVQQHHPSTVIWRNKDQVIDILQRISKLNFNHTFIHEGGGMDLLDIKAFDEKEEDMVILSFGLNMKHVFKVKKLIWELPNEDPKFSYFRLEFDNIKPIYPSTVNELKKWLKSQNDKYTSEVVSEDLIVNDKGEYEHYYEDDEIAHFNVTRWFDGSFLIVHKSSIYNAISNTYDGRHSKFRAEEFREYMEILQYIYNHSILGDYFWDIANRDPFKENLFEELKKIRLMSDEELRIELENETQN